MLSYDVSVFIGGILKWPVYIVEMLLVLFTIVRVFDEKKEEDGIGVLTKVLAFLCVLCTVFIVICFATSIYNTDKIVGLEENYTYFGQMKNGIAEGKGRIFNENGTCIRLGNFTNNKLDGDGKEFDVQIDNKKEKAVLLYEGDYCEGEKCGEGKLYYVTGKNIGEVYYEGQFYEGKMNGYGRLYMEDGKIHEGGFANNQKVGFGKSTWNEDGKEHVLIGVYANDEFTDSGKEFVNGDLVSEGEYRNFSKNGRFKEYYDGDVNKIKFEGNYQNGVRQGSGTEYFKNGNVRYEGNYEGDIWNGKGSVYDESGKLLYQGEYMNGKPCGYGVFYYENGEKKYEGDVLNSRYDGKGISYDENGQKTAEGDYANSKLNGHGKLYNYEEGGKSYEGAFVNGRAHGEGKSFYEDGEIRYEGEYKCGLYDGKGTSYDENGDIEYQGMWKNGEFIE